MRNQKQPGKIKVRLFIATLIVIVVAYFGNNIGNTKKQCAESTGVFNYGAFSKTLDPIGNESRAADRYKECLTQLNTICQAFNFLCF